MSLTSAALTTLALGGAKLVTDQIIKAVSDLAVRNSGNAWTASDNTKIPALFGDLQQFKRLVVTGVAGQGKSILFRYLTLEALAKRELPIFVELRNYQHSPSLRQLLNSELESLGFEDDYDILQQLSENVPITVLLDAFDEIPDDLQQKARKEIEDLARQFRGLRIFVSSRPTLEIQSSNLFDVARLSPLNRLAAIEALRKMCEDRDDPERIAAELKRPAFREVADLLTTPLMVALLLLHFRLSQELPSTLLAFFGDLFEVLYKRHDQTKSYRRTRRSGASEVELRELFGFLSFATRSKGVIETERSKLVDIAEQSKVFHVRHFDSGNAVDDVIQGTNLILQDGAMCRFAHKSIQEFYGAKFLSVQSEDRIRMFCLNRIRNWTPWRQFFEFFELLDQEMFYKHFISNYVSWLAFDEYDRRIKTDWVPSKKTYCKVIGELVIGVKGKQLTAFIHDGQTLYFPGIANAQRLEDNFTAKVAHAVATLDLTAAGAPEADMADERRQHFINIAAEKLYSVADVLESETLGSRVRDVLQPIVTEGVKYVFECYSFVDHRAKQSDLFS